MDEKEKEKGRLRNLVGCVFLEKDGAAGDDSLGIALRGE